MNVFGISLCERPTGIELQAQIRFDTHWVWGQGPFELWYRFPPEAGGHLSDKNGDPFLVACLPIAMKLGESLEIEAPVSPELLSAVPEIQSRYSEWHPGSRKIEVAAEPRILSVPGDRSAGGRALFFSLGVDSFYSLLKRESARRPGRQKVSHLVYVLGFDIHLWEIKRYPPVLKNLRMVAAQYGKSAMPVATNLRELSDRVVDWPAMFHGAALASVGLACAPLFNEALIAASTTFEHLRPWGTHPALDPLFSIESLRFVHDGCEATRFEKARLVANSPVALRTVRVCAADSERPVYNCGDCEKCLRIMISLHVIGALESCETLPHEIDPARVARMRVRSPAVAAGLAGLIDELGSSVLDLELARALRSCLSRHASTSDSRQ